MRRERAARSEWARQVVTGPRAARGRSREHVGRKRRELGCRHITLALLTFSLAVPAQARQPPGTGEISGVVTDAATANPVQGVAVNVYDASGSFAAVGVTDATGHYTAAGLAAGTHYARAIHQDYIDELYDDLLCAPTCDTTSGTPIAVAEGSTSTGVDFALDLGGAIAGTVTASAGGSPIDGANVQVYDAGGSYVTEAAADSSGVYVIPGLPSGTYYAKAHNLSPYVDEVYDDVTCTVCDVTSGTPIAVTRGGTTPGIDFALDLGGQIAGTVTDAADGSPVHFAFVFVYDSSGAFRTIGFTGTSASGDYITYGLPPGSYYAQVIDVDPYLDELYDDIHCDAVCPITSGTPIAVVAGATTGGIDFPLEGPLRFWRAHAGKDPGPLAEAR